MIRPRSCRCRLALALLTLWLGLWPAADAVTGASQVVIVEPASGDAGRRCPYPQDIPADFEGSGCCRSGLAAEAPAADCCADEQARCGRCHTVGGMVLFTVTQWTPSADLVAQGLVPVAGFAGPSRHLQPPVPPPLAVS